MTSGWRGLGHAFLGACLAAAAFAAQAGELRRVGVTLSDLGNPFFVEIARSVEATARRLGGRSVTVSVMSSAYDLERQITQIDGFIAQKVDLIILNAADPVAIEPAVRRARAAGIKVIAVDVAARGADLTVTTDNRQAGRLACTAMARHLGGKGNVVIVNGVSVSAVVDRVAGCREALKAFPQITLLSWDRNSGGSRIGGVARMADLLAAYPRIDGVFAINDPVAEGADQAARMAARGSVAIYGVDGSPGVIERLRDPESRLQGTAAQEPRLMAQIAVEEGVRMLQGKSAPRPMILLPASMVTRDNVAQYKGWAPD
ncbi:ABC transporter substrate-binding protein [Niveibacterium sp. SC-1]|uniref:ABC transporter substrate-binding protein n=1 Tax=Niveibacterium sp. SC-1 TaxID=3135646 RepID=UPI00311EADD2